MGLMLQVISATLQSSWSSDRSSGIMIFFIGKMAHIRNLVVATMSVFQPWYIETHIFLNILTMLR